MNVLRAGTEGLDFGRAKQLAENTPAVLVEVVSLEEAERIVSLFEKVGASVDTATVDNAVVVSADGNADYATIEDAVEHVQEGGIVVVKSGTSKESFVLKKNVSIVGHA